MLNEMLKGKSVLYKLVGDDTNWEGVFVDSDEDFVCVDVSIVDGGVERTFFNKTNVDELRERSVEDLEEDEVVEKVVKENSKDELVGEDDLSLFGKKKEEVIEKKGFLGKFNKFGKYGLIILIIGLAIMLS